MDTLLLTGFERFGNTPVNPAEQVASALDGERIGTTRVVGRVVPSYFYRCIEFVQAAIEEVQPSEVLMMGEYGGRSMITVERIAQNFNDSTRYQIADNSGRSLQGELTAPKGPAAYYSTLPLRAMVKAMRSNGIPSDISDASGTLMCNHLLYGILHHIASNNLPIRVGWAHLPALPSIAALDQNLGMPSMALETSIAGIRACIEAAVAHPKDSNEPLLSRFQI